MNANDRITYYGLIAHGREWAEVLVIREGGRQIAQSPTGRVYATWREARQDNEQKNCHPKGAQA